MDCVGCRVCAGAAIVALTIAPIVGPPSIAGLWSGAAFAAPERVERSVLVGSEKRSYLVSRPGNAAPPCPALVVLHGGTLSATQARSSIGFEDLVDRNGLVAIYPDGLRRRWNDGREAFAGLGDDVSFFRAIVKALTAEGLVDPQRIYVTGPSNGGMMTIRLICEAADLIAAAAPMIANMPRLVEPQCRPSRAVPILLMNGTADSLVPYGGGGVGFRGESGQVLSTDETLAKFRMFNGCTGEPKVDRLPHRDPRDKTDVVVQTWTNCVAGAPVVLYRINGGGHRIPNYRDRSRPIIDALFGAENRDLDGAETVWRFFEDKRR